MLEGGEGGAFFFFSFLVFVFVLGGVVVGFFGVAWKVGFVVVVEATINGLSTFCYSYLRPRFCSDSAADSF